MKKKCMWFASEKKKSKQIKTRERKKRNKNHIYAKSSYVRFCCYITEKSPLKYNTASHFEKQTKCSKIKISFTPKIYINK